MAVTITPLGFKKPDGNELVNRGENVLADNADTAEAAIQAVRGRLNYVEATLAAGGTGGGGEPGGGTTLTPDPDNPGLYFAV